MTNAFKTSVEKPEGKKHFGNAGVDRRIILKWILNKYDMMVRTEFNWMRIGTSGRLF
jgi:hypothetical protein